MTTGARSRPDGRMSSADRRFAIQLALVGALSLAWRVLYVLRWKGNDDDLSDEGDAFYYGAQAATNASGRFFEHPFDGGPAADHPPVTALLLTPISWVTDGSVLAQRLAMVVVGVLVVVAVGLLGRRVAGDRAGIIAAGTAGAYAALWMNDGLLMAETPAALLAVLLLLLAVRLHERVTVARMAALGALVGLATLTRAELALLLPLLGVVPLVRARHVRARTRWSWAGVALAAMAATLAPWAGWNLTRFEEPTLLSTNDGLTVLGANCPSTYFTPAIGFWDLRCALALPQEGDQSQVSSGWRSEGLTFAKDNLGRLPKVVVARVGRVWGVYEPGQMVFFNDGEGREAWASWVGMYQSWALFPVALTGGIVLYRRRAPVLPFVATVITVTVTAATFYGIVRFRVPADVAMAVLAGVAIDAALPGGRDRAPQLAPGAPPGGQ